MQLKNLLVLATILPAWSVSAVNLLPNSSFENDDNRTPQGWVRYRLTPEQAIYSRTSAHSGQRSIGIGSKDDPLSAGWTREEYLPVTPGSRYRLSGWIKTENAWGGNAVAAALYGIENGKPKWKKTEYTNRVEGNHDWTSVSVDFTVPETVRLLKVMVLRRWRGTGIAYFDDLNLELISASPTATPHAGRLNWQIAKPVETFSPGQPLRQTALAVNVPGWEKLEANAGELTLTVDRLGIANTALAGCGWLGPQLPAEPGRCYGFALEIALKKVYHVIPAAICYAADGRILAIFRGAAQHGRDITVKPVLIFHAPPETATVRLALVQNRSSGSCSAGKIVLLEYAP